MRAQERYDTSPMRRQRRAGLKVSIASLHDTVINRVHQARVVLSRDAWLSLIFTADDFSPLRQYCYPPASRAPLSETLLK